MGRTARSERNGRLLDVSLVRSDKKKESRPRLQGPQVVIFIIRTVYCFHCFHSVIMFHSFSKLRYLSLELFGDMVPYLFGTFDFYVTLFLYLFALWMRIYVHYLAQYLFIMVSTNLFSFLLLLLNSLFNLNRCAFY